MNLGANGDPAPLSVLLSALIAGCHASKTIKNVYAFEAGSAIFHKLGFAESEPVAPGTMCSNLSGARRFAAGSDVRTPTIRVAVLFGLLLQHMRTQCSSTVTILSLR